MTFRTTAVALAALLVISAGAIADGPATQPADAAAASAAAPAPAKTVYACPMHPDVKSDKKGTCTICGMDLVPVEAKGQPEKAPTSAPAFQMPRLALPKPLPAVAAKVNDQVISGDRVDKAVSFVRDQIQKQIDDMLAEAPAALQAQQGPIVAAKAQEAVDNLPTSVRNGMIDQALVSVYVAGKNAKATQTQIAKAKDAVAAEARSAGVDVETLKAALGFDDASVEAQAAYRAVQDGETSEEKVKAYVEAHPYTYDGSMVETTHILLRAESGADSDKQLAILKQLKQIKSDIEGGKITFADAVSKYSEDPSAVENQGKMPAVPFVGPRGPVLVMPYTSAAFTTPVGKITDPVRTDYGFHLIRVEAIKENKEAAVPEQYRGQIAKMAILSDIRTDVLLQAVNGKAKIVIPKAEPAEVPEQETTEPAPEKPAESKAAETPAAKAEAKPVEKPAAKSAEK